jgi:hypothetical protein
MYARPGLQHMGMQIPLLVQLYISSGWVRCVMASQVITYKAGDAVAFMPLLVGLKLDGNNDLGLIEPLFRYNPPRASVINQSWKLHHADTLAMVRKAMQLAHTTPLFAQREVNKHLYRDDTTGKRHTDEARISNSYVAVLGKVREIEALIAKKIQVPEVNKMILANAQKMRMDSVVTIRYKSKMTKEERARGSVSEFLQEKAKVIEKQMSSVFDVPGTGFGEWYANRAFDNFWTGYIASDANDEGYESEVVLQEGDEVTKFLKIIDMYKTLYTALETRLVSKNFRTTVHVAYFKANEGVANDSHKDATEKVVDKMIDEYLWNVLLERFEILDSIVCTFFSLIGSTRNAPLNMVNKFMPNAILFCLSSVFKCVTPTEKIPTEICTFFSRYSMAFRSSLDTLFGTELKPIALTDDCRLKMRTKLDHRLFEAKNTLIPQNDTDEDTNNFKQIMVFLNTCLGAVKSATTELKELVTASVDKKNKLNQQNVISVHRKPGKESILLKAIHEYTAASDTLAITAAKTIVYLSLFTNSSAYAKFHYKKHDYSSQPEIAYFTSTHNPLGLHNKATPKPGDEPQGVEASTPSSYQKVVPATMANVLAGTLTQEILAAMELRSDFAPLPLQQAKKNPSQPQTPATPRKSKSSTSDKTSDKATAATPRTPKAKARTASAKSTKGKK